MSIVTKALVYFAAVFATGFVFGVVREVWLVAAVGRSTAVYLELPLMLIVSFTVARAVVRRTHGSIRSDTARIGLLALVLLLVAEAVVGLMVRRMSWAEYMAHFGTGEGAASLAAYVMFGLMPLIVALAGICYKDFSRRGTGRA